MGVLCRNSPPATPTVTVNCHRLSPITAGRERGEFDIIRHYRPLISPPPPQRGSRCGRPLGFASRPGQARHVQRSSPRRRGEGCLKAVTSAADANSLAWLAPFAAASAPARTTGEGNHLGLGPGLPCSPWPSRRRRPSSRPCRARSGLAAHTLSARRAFEGLARWRADRRVQVSRCSPWPWRPPSRQARTRQGEARMKAGPPGTLREAVTAAALS